ncbi:hypothetical protein [Agromyces sp. CCNWLW203]|uniref:hypothetical protein n=1 Tax=Agromyces sp. CCNWLW203 TaxID=3112842 RepID=UPI002F963CE2
MLRAVSSEKVDLTPLSDTMWRVCDSRFEEGALRIIGYVQQVGGEYEMMWMRPRLGVVRRYGSLDEALRAIRETID